MTIIGKYFVDVYKYISLNPIFHTNGTCLIINEDSNYYLELQDSEKKVLGKLLLNSNKIRFVNSNSKKMELIIDLKGIHSINKVGLVFDNSSSSAFTKFISDIDKYVNSKYGELYYSSGNIRYIGPIKNNVCHGNDGIEYYNNNEMKIKFKGEFENGVYDGSGIFLSKCGNITLEVNNIVNETPYDYGILTVCGKKYDIDFGELKNNLDLNDNELCYNVAKLYIDNLDELLFETLSIENKLLVVFKKLQKMEMEMNSLKKKINVNSSSIKNILLCFFLINFF